MPIAVTPITSVVGAEISNVDLRKLGDAEFAPIEQAWNRHSVLLFRREGRLWCKSRDDLFLGGKHAPEGGELEPGVVVTGTDIRFRIEEAR